MWILSVVAYICLFSAGNVETGGSLVRIKPASQPSQLVSSRYSKRPRLKARWMAIEESHFIGMCFQDMVIYAVLSLPFFLYIPQISTEHKNTKHTNA